MNILVNGSSISRGPEAWPYRFQELTGCSIVNLAVAGSGYTYVFETTVTEISQRKYDHVLVMWPESGRIDLRVKDVTRFKDSTLTSAHQVTLNTWPGKIDGQINDQECVQKEWIFGQSRTVTGQLESSTVGRLLEPIYRETDHAHILESELIKIIALQAILKEQNIPYTFMFWQPVKRFDRFKHYYDMIDWNNFYIEDCLHSIVMRNNWSSPNDLHPIQAAHQIFAEQLQTRLNL